MRLFGWLVLSSTAFNILAIVLFAQRFRADAVAGGTAKAGWLLAILVTALVNALLWRWIAINASKIAKWIYIVLTVSSLAGLPRIYMLTSRYGPSYGWLMALSLVFQLGAAIILLQPSVARWLRTRGVDGEVDVTDFE